MRKNHLFLLIFYFLCVLNPAAVRAESSLKEEVRAMKEHMKMLQAQVEILEEEVLQQGHKISEQKKNEQVYEQRINELEDQIARQQTVSAAADRTAKWIPDIGVIADTLVKIDSTKADGEGASRLSVRELEVVFGSEVDPYSRLDATIAFSELEEPALEEAYLTRFDLPGDLTARFGRFKPRVGKAIPVHRDSLDTVDEPLVIQRYFGAEGFTKSGLDLAKTLDWQASPLTHQVSLGVLEGGNGEEGTAFGTTGRAPTVYSHLKNYIDIDDSAGFELGLSHMAGSIDEHPGFEVQVLGADATLTKNFGAGRALKLQGEGFNLNRRGAMSEEEDVEIEGNLWGGYGLVDFRFHPQWSIGGRYDYVDLVDNSSANPDNADRAQTGYLTFYQSEFARWRLQYTHAEEANSKDNNTVYLQGIFAIGTHKHKLQ